MLLKAENDGSQSGIWQPLNPGFYAAEVIESKEVAKEGKTPYLKITLAVQNGNSINNVYDNIILSQRAVWKIEQFLHASGQDIKRGDNIVIDANIVMHKKMGVQIVNEYVDGRRYTRVRRYIRVDDMPMQGAIPKTEYAKWHLTEDGEVEKSPAKNNKSLAMMDDWDDIPF